MKRKHHRNDTEEQDQHIWGSPPFSRRIKISDLHPKRSNRFSIKLNDLEKSNLSKFLKVTQIHSFQCTINLQPSEPGWLILGKINLVASQLCVITLEKVRTKLQIPLKRYCQISFKTYIGSMDNLESDQCLPQGRLFSLLYVYTKPTSYVRQPRSQRHSCPSACY